MGHAQYGFPEGSEGALAFENHTITFDRHWLFGRNGSGAPTSDVPAVLALDLNLPDGAETKTESGIRAVNALDPECPRILRKSPGSFWIDFPLYCRGRQTPLGMLALSCPADLAPERFEILRILAEVASALLAAIEEQEATFQRQVAWQREAMEKAFGATAHHLRARLSALGVLQAEYDEAASGNEEIEKLNEDFSDLLHSLEGELQDIRDRLRPIVAERTRKDVLALFRNTLQRQLPDTAFTLDAEQGRPMADVDTRLLPEVIEELVENAKKAMDREGPLHIDVSIRVIGEGRSIGCVIEFCDNGSGIARELRERVFEDLYSQWPGKKRGNGLGLGFVRRVMEAHGGTARIADSDVGARFVLEFIRFA